MAFRTAVAERDESSCAPAVGVGPLRFGMTVDEVVEAAEVVGQTKVSDCARDHAIFSPTWKAEVHRRGAAPSPPAVTAYVSQAAGLFCTAAGRLLPEGYAGPDDPGVVMRGQPVGQVLRSRPLFMVPRDGAHTEWDSMPSEEYRVNGRSTA